MRKLNDIAVWASVVFCIGVAANGIAESEEQAYTASPT